MRYSDFPKEEQKIIDDFLEKYLDEFGDYFDYDFYSDPENLEDDEIFFQTEDQIRAVIEPWMDSHDSHGSVAIELDEYLNEFPVIGEIRSLEWGYVMAIDNATFLFMSNSWSDSGLFLHAKD